MRTALAIAGLVVCLPLVLHVAMRNDVVLGMVAATCLLVFVWAVRKELGR